MDMALVASNILSADERAAVYDTLAALLHLGNVQLEVDEQDVCSVTEATRAHLAKAEELLGIGEIGNVLIERVLRTPRTGTEYHIALDKTAAVNQRDAFVKFIYSSLFLLIVTRMNAKLDASAKRTHSRSACWTSSASRSSRRTRSSSSASTTPTRSCTTSS